MMNSRGDHLTPIPDAEKEAAAREVNNAVTVHAATPEERKKYGIAADAKPKEATELTFAQQLDLDINPQDAYIEQQALPEPFKGSHSDNKRFRKCLEAGFTMPMLCTAFCLAPRSVSNKIYTWGLRDLFIKKQGIKLQAALIECEKLVPAVDHRVSKKRSKAEEYPDRVAKKPVEHAKPDTDVFQEIIDNGNFRLKSHAEPDQGNQLLGAVNAYQATSSKLGSSLEKAFNGIGDGLRSTFDKLEKLTSTDWKPETIPEYGESPLQVMLNCKFEDPTKTVRSADYMTLHETLKLLGERKQAVEHELATVNTVIDYVNNMMEACTK